MRVQRNVAFLALLLITMILSGAMIRKHFAHVPLAVTAMDERDAVVVLPANTGVAQTPPTPTPLATTVLPAHAPDLHPSPAAPPALLKYTAQPGDTISTLAVEFWGTDTKATEAAIIDCNPSLQSDPDRILAGQTYLIPAAVDKTARAAIAPQAEAEPAPKSPAPDVHELQYSARPGDTVSILAGALLGSNTSEKRDAIIRDNPSLGENPDRVLVGKTYRIPVQGDRPLAAAPSTGNDPSAQPTTQPDADQLVIAGSTRELRYTAKSGDNVSTLAAALLGSDTRENRDVIVNSNPSLKQDPDRVIAGQTYWIPAPSALRP